MVGNIQSPDLVILSTMVLSLNNNSLDPISDKRTCVKKRTELALKGRRLFSGSAASKAVEELPVGRRETRGKG